jgi:hypothetical protein
MLFSNHEKLDDSIIRILLNEKKTAKNILFILENEGFNYTIQAIYVVLRELVSLEIIIKTGFYYKINEEWRNKILETLSNNTDSIVDGEKTIFLLNSLSHQDLQWKNTILPVHNKYPEDPIFFYNYHYIWIHLGETREKSEIDYYESFLKQKRYAFSLIGSNHPLEVETKKMVENEFVRIFIDDKPIQSSGYITIINDYIITSYLTKKTLVEIDNCYKKSTTIPELRRNIQKINFKAKKVKIIIERNRDKAKKLRKKISKDFYIPRELREKFDLF